MPYFDAPLEELRAYRSAVAAPDDLDAYWQEALADARAQARPAVFAPYRPAVYRHLDVFDVTFTGAGGDPVRAWFLCPQGRRGPAAVPGHVHRLRRRPRPGGRAHAVRRRRLRRARRRQPRAGRQLDVRRDRRPRRRQRRARRRPA